MRYCKYNKTLGLAEYSDTLLGLLSELRIFSIKKNNELFTVTEENAECFDVDLTKKELLALADELRELVEKE